MQRFMHVWVEWAWVEKGTWVFFPSSNKILFVAENRNSLPWEMAHWWHGMDFCACPKNSILPTYNGVNLIYVVLDVVFCCGQTLTECKWVAFKRFELCSQLKWRFRVFSIKPRYINETVEKLHWNAKTLCPVLSKRFLKVQIIRREVICIINRRRCLKKQNDFLMVKSENRILSHKVFEEFS